MTHLLWYLRTEPETVVLTQSACLGQHAATGYAYCIIIILYAKRKLIWGYLVVLHM
jgi:hypothetical protein